MQMFDLECTSYVYSGAITICFFVDEMSKVVNDGILCWWHQGLACYKWLGKSSYIMILWKILSLEKFSFLSLVNPIKMYVSEEKT